MSMDSRIITANLFAKDNNGDWKTILSISDVKRAFAGCASDVNVWTVIYQTEVHVFCSAQPSSDVFVILENGT